MMNNLLTPRDWQMEATQRAAAFSGTPEGRMALVEARRYEMLAEEVESLRRWYDAMDCAMVSAHLGIADLRDDPYVVLNKIIAWHNAVALDPSVSREAQDLIDRGAARARLKDHEVAQLVSALTFVAREYGRTEQLRERIAGLIVPLLKGEGFPRSVVNAYAPVVKEMQ